MSATSKLKVLFTEVRSCKLPEVSELSNRIGEHDFIDCYCVEAKASPRQAIEIITAFPRWTNGLVRLRSILTSPFGLSQDGPEADDKVGAFPVESENDTEVIAGFNDKHQDFRVSVISQNNHVYLATWVHTHNIGGSIYLKAIMPFHILIARDALARVKAKCGSQQEPLIKSSSSPT